MPKQRRRESRRALTLALVAAVTSAVVVAAGGQTASGVGQGVTVRWQGLVGGPRPRVTNGQRMIVVLTAPSLADRVAASGGRASDAQEQSWTQAAADSLRALIFKLGVQGVRIRTDFRFTRVLNGFSATLDPRAIGLLERDPGVVGVYPVRTAYPASGPSTPDLGPSDAAMPTVSFQDFDGRGVTIALLDTGVERSHPLIASRILDGVDIVGGDPLATPMRKPDSTGELERHGTQMAGILVGDGGPGGMRGVAPGAAIIPIRVAGWQRDAQGDWGVYARTDQLVAGLENAVDPNQDGDAHDAARVALVALAEPYGAFTDGPAARAARGALALDTLVVAPAGNDGVSGLGYGSVSGPGGAPAALTVGASDLRTQTDEVRVVLRAGLDVVFNRVVPLGGAVAPKEALNLPIAVPTTRTATRVVPGQPAAATALARFFDANGYSTVAGRAALVPAGDDPSATVASAARAGARAVLLYGEQLPAGAFGFDQSASVPVVGLPPAAARELRAAVAVGASAGVAIGAPRTVENVAAGHVAPFSSSGLAFDGRVKPELVAPGVGTATADAGTDDSGTARYGTVNGTSAAAATVAGAAALLAQARPSLDAQALKSLLVASARPLADDSITAQGAGLVDVGAASATELVVSPASLALGRATRVGWQSHQIVKIQNVSTRPVTLKVDVERTSEGAAPVQFEARPRSITLLRGQGTKIRVTLRVTGAPVGTSPAEGAISIQPVGGSPLRIPWALRFDRARTDLLGTPVFEVPRRQSREHVFSPTEDGPAFLYIRAGRVDATSQGPEVRPLARLDIELWTDEGRSMGLLARVRDVIPGQYQFALTGRDPLGNQLAAGSYQLRISGYPTEPGRVSRRALTFTIQ
jgi:subtilisin family serine protease